MHFHEIWCSFSGVVDASVCVNNTFFLKPSIFHIWKQLFEASEMTPHFSQQSHSQKLPRENAPIMHQSSLTHHTSNIQKKKKRKKKQTATQRHLRNIKWKSEKFLRPHDPSMQHIVASYSKHFIYLEESNWEATNSPSSHKGNHKP